MPRFLLLVMTSIWTRISCSTTILEPSVPDGTSLTIDTVNLVDPGTSNFNSKVAAIDGQSNLFTNGELTASNDEFCYNVPSKSKLRARGCVPSNLRTEPQNAPEGETKTPPKDHGGRDFQTPNEDIKANPSNQGSDQGETKPEEESGLPIQLTAKNPWLECRKYLRGILKYAVCDYPDPEFARYEPLPLVWLNAPFWSLSRCTLGKLVSAQKFPFLETILADFKLTNFLFAQKWQDNQSWGFTPALIRPVGSGAAGNGTTTFTLTWGPRLAALHSTFFNWPAMFSRKFPKPF